MSRSRTPLFLVALVSLLISVTVQAANVALYSTEDSPSVVPAPHTATSVTLGEIESGVLAGYDVFLIGHIYGGSTWSVDACNAVQAFLTAGGGVVTEWNGLGFLFENYDPSTYFPMDLPQCGFFAGTVSEGNAVGTATPIDIIDPGSPLVTGLADPFQMGGGSQFFFVAGIDTNEWSVAAQFTGHGGTWPALFSSDMLGGIVAVGVMDYFDVLPGDANAETLLSNMITYADTGVPGEPQTTARFLVTKAFSDGSTDEVNVTLTCNTGLPLEQSFTIAGGDPAGVTFVVTEITPGATNCEVTESGHPAGYTPEFNGGDGCAWTEVTSGLYQCEIYNQANPATFTVYKEWEVFNDGGDSVLEEAYVTIYCDSVILNNGMPREPAANGLDNGNGYYYSISDYLGDGGSLTATVDTTDGPATCWADESIDQSGVESEDDCGPREIPAGGASSCTFVNTVFFEGIPTLSQYGLALMALLMLGVGLVGFRRFA